MLEEKAVSIHDDVEEILFTEEQLHEIVARIGAQINRDYAGKNLLMVSVLKGSLIFMADLMRQITIHCAIDFLAVSSYGNGTTSSGEVRILKDLDQSLAGKDILVVEDILDSGNTLAFLKNYLMAKGARSISIVTLLDKPARREKAVEADLAGFVVPDEFVVGYGLDYAQLYRNLPYIGVLKPAVYEHT